jgi:N-acetylglucosaminyldiphosphoundecaprenol N-acetyl-beta-D-mannosaminyltransferase
MGTRVKVALGVDAATGHVTIAGREIFAGDADALVERIGALIAAGGRHFILTVNVQATLLLEDSAQFRDVFERADLLLADGMPLVMLGRRLGARGTYRLTGADLLPLACRVAAGRGWRIAIVGADAETRARAVAEARRRDRRTEIAAFEVPLIATPGHPGSGPAVAALKTWGPSLVFVCLGAPKQEEWYDAWKAELPEAVYVGAGASAAFLAGTAKRAPVWMQSMALEWFWRLLHEPRRLANRCLVRGPRFLFVIARSLRAARGK